MNKNDATGNYHFTPFTPDSTPDLPLSSIPKDLEEDIEKALVEARPKVVMAFSVVNFCEINEQLAKMGLDASYIINIQFVYSQYKVYYRV